MSRDWWWLRHKMVGGLPPGCNIMYSQNYDDTVDITNNWTSPAMAYQWSGRYLLSERFSNPGVMEYSYHSIDPFAAKQPCLYFDVKDTGGNVHADWWIYFLLAESNDTLTNSMGMRKNFTSRHETRGYVNIGGTGYATTFPYLIIGGEYAPVRIYMDGTILRIYVNGEGRNVDTEVGFSSPITFNYILCAKTVTSADVDFMAYHIDNVEAGIYV